MPDWISFTTDYGLDDGFVASCVGVIASIAPGARLIHITHLVPPRDIRRGSLVLAQTAPYLPPAIHLAVVDPGVGTPRRPIVIVTPGGALVGPDNGLLIPAAENLGGIRSAHLLAEPRYRRPVVSPTFHGRDLFAPAAAHLAASIPPEDLGPALDPATLIRLPTPRTTVTEGKIVTEVLTIDRFGNLQLAAESRHLHTWNGPRIRVNNEDATLGQTFADAPPGTLVVLIDSAGQIAIARNGASAAAHLQATPGDQITLTAVP